MFILVVRMVLAICMKAIGGFSQQRWVHPFALRLEEESERVRTDVDAV